MNYILKSLKLLTVPLMISHCDATTVVFTIGDGFNPNGTGSFGSNPLDNAFSEVGNPNRDSAFANVEFSSLVNLTNPSSPNDGFGTIGDGFDPFVVGSLFGNTFRSGLDFDISGIQAAPAGFEFQVANIELFLEVSGATFTNGVPNGGDSVTVDFFANQAIGTGALTGSADTSFTISNSDSSVFNFDPGNTPFFSVNFDPALLDLNSDTNFEVVLDAGSSPTTSAVFGSSLAPGFGITGTENIGVAPALVITAVLVAVPEPSSVLLVALGGVGLLARRRRSS